MPLTADQQAAFNAALGRLANYYDGDHAYNPSSYPGAFRQGGSVINFVPSLKDVATVIQACSTLVADATAAATSSPKAVRVDSQQSFADAEADQGRWNLRGPVPLSTSADTVLTVLDAGRDVFATNSPKITAANGGAGWASGPIFNDNPVTGLVTLAVPAGATLDGVQDGTTLLFPFQKARIRQVGSTAYRTVWIDRAPIIAQSVIATPVASADFNLPVGYSRFGFALSNVVMSAANVTLAARLSDNGSAAVKSGGSDYYNVRHSGTSGNTSAAFYEATSWITLGASLNDAGGQVRTMTEGRIHPGGSGSQQPLISARTVERDTTPYFDVINIGAGYNGATSGVIGRVNLIRILAGTGTFTGNLTIWGEP